MFLFLFFFLKQIRIALCYITSINVSNVQKQNKNNKTKQTNKQKKVAIADSKNNKPSSILPLIDKIILVSPFTNMLELSQHLIGYIPFMSYFVSEKLDNRKQISQLVDKAKQEISPYGPVQITIFHGNQDIFSPVQMGRALSELAAKHIANNSIGSNHVCSVQFIVDDAAAHQDIFDFIQVQLFDVLNQ